MRKTLNGLLSLLVLLAIFIVPITKAAYDHTPAPKLAEDIIDSLIVVPRKIVERFGQDGERVRLIYNIALQRDVIVSLEKRVIAIEGEVKILSRLKLEELRGVEPEVKDEVVE